MGVGPRFAPSVSSVGNAGRATRQRHSSKDTGQNMRKEKRCFQQILLIVSRVNYSQLTHLTDSKHSTQGATAACACKTILIKTTLVTRTLRGRAHLRIKFMHTTTQKNWSAS